jgi:hypothetical protein
MWGGWLVDYLSDSSQGRSSPGMPAVFREANLAYNAMAPMKAAISSKIAKNLKAYLRG